MPQKDPIKHVTKKSYNSWIILHKQWITSNVQIPECQTYKIKDLITLGKEYDSWNFKKSKAEILMPSLPLG